MNWLDKVLKDHLPKDKLEFVNNFVFGYILKSAQLPLPALDLADSSDIELKGYDLTCGVDTSSSCSEKSTNVLNVSNVSHRPITGGHSRIVRVGLFQNSIVEPTDAPIQRQKDALLELGAKAISIAAKCNVNVFCFQELWNMPFAFCTQKKLPWTELAENVLAGQTTQLLKRLALENNMVIVSSILERDDKDFLWNSVVVIDANGEVLGTARKNHIPISGKFSETGYYRPSNSGVPVFDTKFGRIGLTICYDRHQMQNWYMHRLNQAEIVFNPTATVQTFSEPFWGVEARHAAFANGYYVCAINRVGVEHFKIDENKQETGGPYFGSSFVTAPNGMRTPALSSDKNGLLIADLDLDTCVKFQENWDDLANIARVFSTYE